MARGYRYYEAVEKNAALLGILIFVAVSFGGLAELVPLFIDAHTIAPPPGVKPYDPLRLAGKDIYVREGCYLCHSQMIRALRAETQRYGHFSVASESVYDRPFQWGSKRTGPDLARVGGKYSDDWQHRHLLDPRAFVPDSNMSLSSLAVVLNALRIGRAARWYRAPARTATGSASNLNPSASA